MMNVKFANICSKNGKTVICAGLEFDEQILPQTMCGHYFIEFELYKPHYFLKEELQTIHEQLPSWKKKNVKVISEDLIDKFCHQILCDEKVKREVELFISSEDYCLNTLRRDYRLP